MTEETESKPCYDSDELYEDTDDGEPSKPRAAARYAELVHLASMNPILAAPPRNSVFIPEVSPTTPIKHDKLGSGERKRKASPEKTKPTAPAALPGQGQCAAEGGGVRSNSVPLIKISPAEEPIHRKVAKKESSSDKSDENTFTTHGMYRTLKEIWPDGVPEPIINALPDLRETHEAPASARTDVPLPMTIRRPGPKSLRYLQYMAETLGTYANTITAQKAYLSHLQDQMHMRLLLNDQLENRCTMLAKELQKQETSRIQMEQRCAAFEGIIANYHHQEEVNKARSTDLEKKQATLVERVALLHDLLDHLHGTRVTAAQIECFRTAFSNALSGQLPAPTGTILTAAEAALRAREEEFKADKSFGTYRWSANGSRVIGRRVEKLVYAESQRFMEMRTNFYEMYTDLERVREERDLWMERCSAWETAFRMRADDAGQRWLDQLATGDVQDIPNIPT